MCHGVEVTEQKVMRESGAAMMTITLAENEVEGLEHAREIQAVHR